MTTSMMTFALAGALLAGQNASPTWESSYSKAQQHSATMKKPMAVFIGDGANGWSQVVRDGAPSAQVSQLLGEKYLCVYIDLASAQGRKFAQAIEIEDKPGLVLSNATGELQAFWHAGKLTNKGLARYLQKYADPRVVLNGTETADAVAIGSEPVVNSSVPVRTTPPVVQAVPVSKVTAPSSTVATAPTEKIADAAPLVWQPTYLQGRKMSADMKKPLAIAFGSGANGWSKLVRDGAPNADVSKMLAESYVCVYADITTPAGKKLAEDFGITAATGIVLSDRAGSLQAFWHQGDLTNQSMASYLRKYADPQVVVRGTETVSTTARTSFYPSSEAEGNWGATGSSYCPSCNNARGRR